MEIAETAALEGRRFDLVLCDAPCSGSGAWRRAPEGKWRLNAAGLSRLVRLQREILDRAARHVRPGGYLAYVTCSLLGAENEAQTEGFVAGTAGLAVQARRRLLPAEGGDGFWVAILKREK